MASAARAQTGSIRGVVIDQDFDAPLPEAKITIAEINRETTSSEQGTFVFAEVPPGVYTLMFRKEGYVTHVRNNVLVEPGELADLQILLTGDFAEMQEFIVEDVSLGAGSELQLLQLRGEAPALIDSIGSELMSRAGASDAASALTIVSGASVQDGKFAVIRGLPDRYVSSQMNGVRLPTADENKRAVELDQFPSAVIESLQVSKTFTPDQQGDASGGAVNVRLKGIPDDAILEFKAQYGYNSQVGGRDDFLTYRGGGIDFLGKDDKDREFQPSGTDWRGAVGVEETEAPLDWKASFSAGGHHTLDGGIRIGGFASIFYERDNFFDNDGVSDAYWVRGDLVGTPPTPGDPQSVPFQPQTEQGTVPDGAYKTRLYDVTRATQSVQWGTLGTLGMEVEDFALGLSYLYTRTTSDSATLAEDTRGKEFAFGPSYDPNDPNDPGNQVFNLDEAPYLRLQTLDYNERTTETFQLSARDKLPFEFNVGTAFAFERPELDLTLATSSASFDQPDKRQFGTQFLPQVEDPGIPPFIPPSTDPSNYIGFKPAENANVGFLQRIFKTIDEDSDQVSASLKLPFEQWAGHRGFFKTGIFHDRLNRQFRQETFSNSAEGLGASPDGLTFNDKWSDLWDGEVHLLDEALNDIDYDGFQRLAAWYWMVDMPLLSWLNVIGGARYQITQVSTEINAADEPDALYFPLGSVAPIFISDASNPDEYQADIDEDDLLPAAAIVVRPTEELTFRAAYSETIALPTFKELTPVIQQEFAGAPIFIGNSQLRRSTVENYDLRLDYEPVRGSLLSVSWFRKNVFDAIENIQRVAGFAYTQPRNFEEGELKGYEFEVRQDLGRYFDRVEGLSVGVNATLIDSEVQLPASELANFEILGFPIDSTRPMTNAPEHLYNLYLTYDFERTGTQLSVFYTVQGDTLTAGPGRSANNFVPSIFQTEFGTLNVSFTQRLTDHLSLRIQGKNLTNPEIQEVYRSDYHSGDQVRTSFSRGADFSISLALSF